MCLHSKFSIHRCILLITLADFPHRIIVGAPRGTYPGGLSLPENGMAENQTGLIYDCPIQLGDCNGLFGSGSGNDLRLFDPEGKLRFNFI